MSTVPTPRITLAALDMAGTTVDEGGLVYDALRGAVEARLGHPIDDAALHAWVGTSKREAVAGLLRDAAQGSAAADTVVDTVYGDFEERLDRAYRDAVPRPFPGVVEALEVMRDNGIRVVLQTGYARPVAERLLAGLGWQVGRDVDGLVTSDEVRASRPAPYLVHHAMELVDVRDVAQVLVAGDTVNDLGAGRAAGASYVVGVLTGSGTRAELEEGPSTHVVDGVADLPRLLGLPT